MILTIIFLASAGLLFSWMTKTKRYAHLDFPQISKRGLLISIALALPLFYFGLDGWNDENRDFGESIFSTGFPLTSFVLDFAWSNWDQWWGVASLAGAFILQWILWGQLFAFALYWDGLGREEMSSFIKTILPENKITAFLVETKHQEHRDMLLFGLIVALVILWILFGLITWLGS